MTGGRTVVESVPAALDGERIDRVVSLITGVSRRQADRLLADGRVTVDGSPPGKGSSRVALDATIRIELPPPDTGTPPDPGIEVTVIHADEHVIVVDKPAGQVVHPGSGVRHGTLVEGLLARYPELAGIGEPDRPGIVHRLDRGTSGLLMVARSSIAYESLVRQLASRTVHRRYRSLVCGLVESSEGLIDAPLGRSPRDATRRAVVADGRPARTRYEVLARYPSSDCTSLACRLETGRTHQIRAHLAAIGHPVVGDTRYGGRGAGLALRRPFLHAAELGFDHPATDRPLRFDSPLPPDLAAALAQLEAIEAGHHPDPS